MSTHTSDDKKGRKTYNFILNMNKHAWKEKKSWI